jgi:tetratricopeptide (TPR) repeat protein
MKRSGAREGLVTPGKINKGMWGNKKIKLIIVALLSLGWAACNSTRNISTTETTKFVEFSPKDSVEKNIYADSIFISAEAYKETGDLKKAISDFTLFLHYKPGNTTANFELSRIFLQLQNATFALMFAQRAAIDSSNIWFQLNYADALALNKKYEEAANVFARLSKQYPANTDYFYNEGVLLSNAGKYDSAMEVFDSIEQKNGTSEDAVFQKQRIYLKKGNVTAAADEVRKLITMDPDEPRYYGLLAQVYSQNDMPDSAVAVYQELLQKDPDNPQALIAVALNYKRQGDENTYYKYMARAFANPSLDIEDKINFIYPFLKYVEVDSTQKNEALTLCRMVLQAHPNDARAYALYGDMYFQCREPDSALREYYKAIQLDSSNIDVWQQVMQIYSIEQKNDSLLNVSQEVMELFPDNFLGFYFNGAANILQGNYQQGIMVLQNALANGITDRSAKSEIFSLLGEAYNDTGDYNASDSCFDSSLLLVPNNDEVLNNYSYYLAERDADLEKAARMSKASLELSPNNYMYEDTYAWILFKMKKYKEAKEWMEKVLSHKQALDGPGYLEHYGDILYKLKQVNEAVKYWQMAKEKGASSPILNEKIEERKLVASPASEISKQ